MSDSGNGFFAPPAFKPDEALPALKRQLRDTALLAERGNGYEWSGKRVVELAVDGTSIVARIVKRPAMSPEWESLQLKSSPDVRKFVDEVKKRLARWSEE